MWHPHQLTHHLDPSHSIHEQGRNDVPRQDRQTAKEANEVSQEVVILLEVHVAAFLLFQKGGVDKPTVDELMLVEVWGEKEMFGSCKADGGWEETGAEARMKLRPFRGQAAQARGKYTFSTSRCCAAGCGWKETPPEME